MNKTTIPQKHLDASQTIREQIEEFFSRGGKIEEIKEGERTEKIAKPARWSLNKEQG